MTNRIVLIGAGSANFGLGTIGDIFRNETLRGSTIVLHDIDPQALHYVESIASRHLARNDLPFTLHATTSRQEALQGADFCIISIEVDDRFELWEQDWKIPLQHGIRQIYGENGGPGGLFHALRIIPPILDICGDIADICPDAYVFNFSNPMSRICLTVKRKFPHLKLIGLCHEVASLVEHLPPMLGTPLSNLAFTAGGLNHFSVLLEVAYRDTGRDAYPDVRARAIDYFSRQWDSAEFFKRELTPQVDHPPF
ncbi:MAG: alpha-glucosidase, partial [Anaerolineae bacterium]|nr:alpha-glucosidase [Anaerolineae bacterium]